MKFSLGHEKAASVPCAQSINNHNEINHRWRAKKHRRTAIRHTVRCWSEPKTSRSLAAALANCKAIKPPLVWLCNLSLSRLPSLWWGGGARRGRTFPAARLEKVIFRAWLWRVACTKALTVLVWAAPIQINIRDSRCAFVLWERAAACYTFVFMILVTRIARATRRNKIDPRVAALGHIYICSGANETQKAAWFGAWCCWYSLRR